MIDSFWIMVAYFFVMLLGFGTYLLKKISFTIFNGFIAAWVFILGGTHQLFFGETIITVVIGGGCVWTGFYLDHCYRELLKLDREVRVIEGFCKTLKEERDKKIKKQLWAVRN